MKLKRVCMLFVFLILINMSFAIAAVNDSLISLSSVDKAYTCLETQLADSCGASKTAEQLSLNLLAISYNSNLQKKCISALNELKKSDCFSETSSGPCSIKSTAMALLALNNIGEKTSVYADWLLTKRKFASDLLWYLEIDSNNATTCKIKVGTDSEKTFTISSDKKIFGTSNCLSVAEEGYFLKIANSCLDKSIIISCSNDFITTLLYKKSTQTTYHVSSETHSASSGGSTEELVNSYCFSLGNSCDYEGTLWAALALAKSGKEISSYIPYISASSEDAVNKKYFSSVFLYLMLKDDEYLTDLLSLQKESKYWDESGKKLYDTSLALLSVQDQTNDEVTNARNYLLGIQESSGCWQSYTNFILYSAWPKTAVISIPDKKDCKNEGNYCTSAGYCALTDKLEDYYCSSLSHVCCSIKPAEETCEEKQGIECSSNQVCSIPEVSASDTSNCCLDRCEEKPEETECESEGYSCKSFCSSTEEEKTDYSSSCILDEICCGNKSATTGFFSWTTIIILIILIILIALAIIFKNKLRLGWFKLKSKFKTRRGPAPTSRPSSQQFPTIFSRPRPILPRPNYQRPMQRKPITPARKSERDTEFDEVMKKLREMSK